MTKGRRRALWAHIEVPDFTLAQPDLVFVSQHDFKDAFEARANVHRIAGVPHRIRRADIEARRDAARSLLGLGARDRLTVFLVGGPNGAFAFQDATTTTLKGLVQARIAAGERVAVTASRRTPQAVVSALAGLRSNALMVYDGAGPNPYDDFLAAGDGFVVTEDSITMCCETLATGRPVRLLRLDAIPGPRLQKFRSFQHLYVDELGLLAEAGGDIAHSTASTGRSPPDDTDAIAVAILAALSR